MNQFNDSIKLMLLLCLTCVAGQRADAQVLGRFSELQNNDSPSDCVLEEMATAGAVQKTFHHALQPGKLTQTGVATHLAINGGGFFKVVLPNGLFAYTRDGSFIRNADGLLVNGNGYPLEPNINVPNMAEKITISTDGEISYLQDGEISRAGKIHLIRFWNPTKLQQHGTNIYLSTDSSGPAMEGAPGDSGFGTLRQGTIEDLISTYSETWSH